VPPTHHRLPGLLGGLVLLASALVATVISAPQGALQARPAFVSTCLGYCKHPTNAGKVFRWGHEAWRQEFETGPFSRHWRSNHPRQIGQQKGMLTIESGRHSGTIAVWPDNQAATTGRWEARVRPYERSGSGTRYRFVWELVPAGRNTRCGANEIVLATYVPGDKRVHGHVRTLADNSFTFSRSRDLRNRAWHTYAVEITKRHISWFVDTQVVRTEKRPAALAGVKYRPQFMMKATPHRTMRPSWLQADWVRYYTLQRHNARSISAPPMHRMTYPGGC
jgi:hypothetical protein